MHKVFILASLLLCTILFSTISVFGQEVQEKIPVGKQATTTIDRAKPVSPSEADGEAIADEDATPGPFEQNLAPSLLWKIDHDSLSASSYLYGTMHLPDSRVIALFDSVGNTINRCDAVAVELIMNPSDAFSMMPAMVMKDSTLADFYTPEELDRVNQSIKEELGIMGLFSKRMKPIFISTSIQQMRFGGDINQVVDTYIQDLAKKMDKKLIGIETMEEQMDALTSMSLQSQADMLLEYIDDIEQNDSLTTVLVNTYLDQSLNGLMEIYSEDELPEEMNDDLVIIRNIKMAKRVVKMMQKQSTFIAVGALHLPGETGLINVLRNSGFTVEAAQK